MVERILVPFDGSPKSVDALDLVFDHFPDAAVTALYVIEVPDGRWAQAVGPELQVPVTDRHREYAEELFESARNRADAHGRELDTAVVTGEPDHRIVERAEAESVDLIVIGSHGREGISRILLGSVAEKVVRRSPVSVLVVR